MCNHHDVAFFCTGEVTLTGRVLPIGGLKEKLLAAKRSDVTTVVFPEANRKDWDELSGEHSALLLRALDSEVLPATCTIQYIAQF